MSNKEIRSVSAVIKAYLIDDLIVEINKLDLSDTANTAVVDLLNQQRQNKYIKKAMKGGKSPAKKREIPEEKKCKRPAKSGANCNMVMCDKELKSCWTHMTKQEQTAYQSKKEKNKTSKSKK